MLGIKTKIGFNVFIVILASMSLLLIIASIAMQRLLIDQQIDSAENIAHLLRISLYGYGQTAPVSSSTLHATLSEDILELLKSSYIKQIMFFYENKFESFDFQGSDNKEDAHLQQLMQRAKSTNRIQSSLDGKTSMILSLAGRRLLTAVPFYSESVDDWAVIGICITLDGLQLSIESLRRLLCMYLLINTLIFTIIGFFRLRKLTWIPLEKLLRKASTFQSDQLPVFHSERAGSEFNQLSQALNHMLQHIHAEKMRLNETVVSLTELNKELKHTQDDMIKAEKFAGIGRLSSALAHEIGNPISVILGYVELLRQDGASDADRSDWLQRMENEIQRINRTIRQLLDVARSHSFDERALVNVHPMLVEVSEIVKLQPLMANIRVQMDLLATHDIVLAQDDRLRQVFINLIINAADAIRSANRGLEGILSIQTQLIPKNLDKDSMPSGYWLEIRISDNGCGISQESLPNIFDPFFTTKDPGKGTGLGLYVSFRMIEEIGGSMHATSIPGSGTTMVVRLPLHMSNSRF